MKALASVLMFVALACGLPAICSAVEPAGGIDLESIRETIDRLGLNYTVEENWVTRLAPEERCRLCGVQTPIDYDGYMMWESRGPGGRTRIDWRDVGGRSYVSGVRDQGPCGSCWAFGPVAIIESAKMIALDEPDTDPDLAEQYVLTCNWAQHGCGGGDPPVALELARLGGIPPESCNPYEAGDMLACHTCCPESYDVVEKIAGWGVITGDWLDIDAINAALESGPITASFEVYESFFAYSGGVYSAQGSVPTGGWHCVALVGFNDREGYWIAKNSWGEHWGEEGYFRISYNSWCKFGYYTLACAYSPAWDEPVRLSPEVPTAGDPVTVLYDPAGRWLDGTPTCIIHRGHNGWTGITNNPMAWNPGEDAWEVTFTVPPDAHNIQLVFTDGGALWDNNGGPDWSYAVNNSGDAFVMDGYLDPSVPLLSGGSPGLYGVWRDGMLYLATLSVGSTPGMDHFLMVLDDQSGTTGAVWAKAGTTVPWAYFLGMENSNGWAGWFDAGQAVQAGPEFAFGNTGPYIEGTLDIDALYGGMAPAQLWVAAAAYDNPDGGALLLQSPPGDADGNLEAPEFYMLESPPPAAAGIPGGGGEWRLAVEPNPFSSGVAVELSLPAGEAVRVDVFDVLGRRVATLHDGPAGPGAVSLHWNVRDLQGNPCATGIYFFQARSRTRSLITKATLLK